MKLFLGLQSAIAAILMSAVQARADGTYLCAGWTYALPKAAEESGIPDLYYRDPFLLAVTDDEVDFVSTHGESVKGERIGYYHPFAFFVAVTRDRSREMSMFVVHYDDIDESFRPAMKELTITAFNLNLETTNEAKCKIPR